MVRTTRNDDVAQRSIRDSAKTTTLTQAPSTKPPQTTAAVSPVPADDDDKLPKLKPAGYGEKVPPLDVLPSGTGGSMDVAAALRIFQERRGELDNEQGFVSVQQLRDLAASSQDTQLRQMAAFLVAPENAAYLTALDAWQKGGSADGWIGQRSAAQLEAVRNAGASGPDRSDGVDGVREGDDQWEVVMEDDFSGSKLDASKWNILTTNKPANGELQAYTNREKNVRVEDGKLVLEAHREPHAGKEYTSGRIDSAGKMETKYGRIEARIKLPEGKGLWPAFWMLGADRQQKGWPACGEIDIMEFRGDQTQHHTAALHGPGYSNSNPIKRDHQVGQDLTKGFHDFAVEWSPDKIQFFMDGKPWGKPVTPDELPAGKQWVFDKPHYLLLNLAVGGSYAGGGPNGSTELPARMEVDWVRVMKRKDDTGA